MSENVVVIPGAEKFDERPAPGMDVAMIEYLENVICDIRAGKVVNCSIVTSGRDEALREYTMMSNRVRFAGMLSYMMHRVWESD